MDKVATHIKGVYEFHPRVFEDKRGFFVETFKESEFEKLLPGVKFVQDNHSGSQVESFEVFTSSGILPWVNSCV